MLKVHRLEVGAPTSWRQFCLLSYARAKTLHTSTVYRTSAMLNAMLTSGNKDRVSQGVPIRNGEQGHGPSATAAAETRERVNTWPLSLFSLLDLFAP
jgi:hypothetical protein